MTFTAQLSPLEAEILDLIYAAEFTGIGPTADSLSSAAGCTPPELQLALVELRRQGCILWHQDQGRIGVAPLRR